jgi:hypothetical protein
LIGLDELVELITAIVQPILERIGQGHNLDVLGRLQDIIEGPLSAAAAADETDFDDIVSCGMNVCGNQARCQGRSRGGYRGGFEEITAGWLASHQVFLQKVNWLG